MLSFLFPPSLGRARASARAEFLQSALSNAFGEPIHVDVSHDYRDLEERALSGEADMVWAPAGVCARIEGAARAVFKAVRGMSSTYRAALVARTGSGVTLAALERKTAAWVDPLSVGGYLLVRSHLTSLGIDPDRTFREQRFVGSHPAVVAAIIHGEVDVGAVTVPRMDEASVREAIRIYVGDVASRIEVVTISDEAPTDAIVITRHMPTYDAKRMESMLAPNGMDVRPPACLLDVMQAETLLRARPGEYMGVLRMIRGSPLYRK
jgi:ABC-type phosphate/phosphonate transport system substrate-binding protein